MSRLITLLVTASLGLSAAAPAHCVFAAETTERSATAAAAGSPEAEHHTAYGHHGGSDAGDGESRDRSSESPTGCPMVAVCTAPALPGVQQEHATDVTRALERVRSGSHSPSRADLGTDPPPPRPAPHA